MKSKHELRELVRANLDAIIGQVNDSLQGKKLTKLEPVLKRIGRGGVVPHWFATLKNKATLPNLDGKTIGSVVEMLLVAVIETNLLAREKTILRVNPARGVDLPDLDLGVKSPSENYCTSEPFFSAYERLLGSEHSVLVLLTDYQQKKKTPPLKLQITNWSYLEGSELADRNLCSIAFKHRDRLINRNESWAKKLLRFLSYVNQSDWLAKQLLKSISLIDEPQDKSIKLSTFINAAETDFVKQNSGRAKKLRPLIPDEDLEVVRSLHEVEPLELAIIDAADNWVISTFHEAGRFPNTNEWDQLKKSPLNGKIGVSAALQWRYNFSSLFKIKETEEENEG
jgi:hypothetical protein